MNKRREWKFMYWAALCGPIWVIGYAISFGLLGHDDPPPSNGLTAHQLLHQYFQPYHNQIMWGMIACMVVGVFYLPAGAVQGRLMMRGENRSMMLGILAVCGAAITAWIVAQFPGSVLTATTISSQHPDQAQTLWRGAWYLYDNTYMCTGFEIIALSIYTLVDRSRDPIWPKWTAWVGLFALASFIPECAIPFDHTGAISLQGWWNFWIAFAAWLVWFGSCSFYTVRYIRGKLALSDAELEWVDAPEAPRFEHTVAPREPALVD